MFAGALLPNQAIHRSGLCSDRGNQRHGADAVDATSGAPSADTV